MKWLWTWDGQCFGYREHEDLWTCDGKHVGKIDGTDVYDSNGNYLGEIMNKERLITCISKKRDKGFRFKPYANRQPVEQNVNYAKYAMFVGYEDFPKF